jgi:hypothetical protein
MSFSSILKSLNTRVLNMGKSIKGINDRLTNSTKVTNEKFQKVQNSLETVLQYSQQKAWKPTATTSQTGFKDINSIQSFSDKAKNALSGFVVSQSSDGLTIAYSSPYYKPSSKYLGQVTVYSYNGTTWNIKGASINPTTLGLSTNYSYYFGAAMALSGDGNTLVISAPFAPGYTNGVVNSNLGSVGDIFILNWNGSTWVKQFQFSLNGGTDYQTVIDSLSTDSSLVVGLVCLGGVSISSDNSTVAFGPGFVYTYNGSSWVKKGNSITLDGNLNSNVAFALDSDGSSLAFASFESSTGSVMVYDYDSNTDLWEQRGNTLCLAGSEGSISTYNSSQSPLSLSTSSLDISQDSNTVCFSDSINVYVYVWNGISWEIQGSAIPIPSSIMDPVPANNSNFGICSKLTADQNGNTLVLIGAPNAYNSTTSNTSLASLSGAILLYVFNPQNENWTLKVPILYPSQNAYNNTNKSIKFGASLAITPYIDDTTNYNIIIGDPQYQPTLSSTYSTYGMMGYAATYSLVNI